MVRFDPSLGVADKSSYRCPRRHSFRQLFTILRKSAEMFSHRRLDPGTSDCRKLELPVGRCTRFAMCTMPVASPHVTLLQSSPNDPKWWRPHSTCAGCSDNSAYWPICKILVPNVDPIPDGSCGWRVDDWTHWTWWRWMAMIAAEDDRGW